MSSPENPSIDNNMDQIKTRLSEKIKNESNLGLLKKLFKDLPNLDLYLVGGMVRDLLYKKQTAKDYDFVAGNITAEDLKKSLGKYGNLDLVGRNFGVFKFTPENSTLHEAIDIALPRRDLSFGTGGYRDFDAQTDPQLKIETDLARRDLTINAIAWDIKKQALIDPFDGQKDLKNGIIRTVGKPEERFQEDYSRLLRAIRFACRFNFQIEENTWQALKKLMPKINDERQNKAGKTERVVPMETISAEIFKSLKENPSAAVELLDASGALKEIMPEALTMKGVEQPKNFHAEGDVWQHSLLMLKKIKSPEFRQEFPHTHLNPALILAIFLHDIGKPLTFKSAEETGDRIRFNGHDQQGAILAKKICARLKLSSEDTNLVQFVIEKHMIPMTADIAKIKNTTIEKTFMSKYGKELMMLIYLDSIGTVAKDGSVDLSNYLAIKNRVAKLEARQKQKDKLLPDLLTGMEIMDELRIKPGKIIGQIKEMLRENQLSGEINDKDQARKWLNEHSYEFKK